MPGEAPNAPSAQSALHPLAQKALASFIAADPRSQAIVNQLHKIAASNATVLIQGESGTGKDLLASLLHYLGPHPEEPLIKIDCASLPPSLMESELFGYERGAFTGAGERKLGRLELAADGTIVLDEVSALSLAMQAKLLRVLEERQFLRLGGVQPMRISAQARFVAISNADLQRLVVRGVFREDLYYRLHVVPLEVAPLRARQLDIAPLAEHWVQSLALARGIQPRRLSPPAMAALEQYSFPGNVRELRNVIERLLISGGSSEIALEELPPQLRTPSNATGKGSLEQLERAYIAEVLDFTRGSKSRAAEILGISRKTLLEKRKRYGLD